MKKSIRTFIQLLSFSTLAALCIYLFPRYTNPFKYHFEVGQPWGYGLVTAEYDFPIYKPEARLQEEIEQAMGIPLNWNRLDNKKTSYICTYLPGLDFKHPDNYPQLMHQIIDLVLKMKKVFPQFM